MYIDTCLHTHINEKECHVEERSFDVAIKQTTLASDATV